MDLIIHALPFVFDFSPENGETVETRSSSRSRSPTR
jgi:hypothetical protein